MRQIFDDGGYLDYDAAGNPVGGMDYNGTPIPAPSTAIVDQVMALLNLGVRAAIYDRYPNAAPQAAGVTPQALLQQQQQQRMMIQMALLAAGAFLVYKLAT